jgi:hypothetical protein
MFPRRVLFLLLCFGLFLVGCGSNSSTSTQIKVSTPRTAPANYLIGTWSGQETKQGFTGSYNVTLVVVSVVGKTFTGTFEGGPGTSTVPVQNGQLVNGTVSFKISTQVMSITAKYTGAITGTKIVGSWNDKPDSDSGSFTLEKDNQ